MKRFTRQELGKLKHMLIITWLEVNHSSYINDSIRVLPSVTPSYHIHQAFASIGSSTLTWRCAASSTLGSRGDRSWSVPNERFKIINELLEDF
jgi:hypothetical protein